MSQEACKNTDRELWRKSEDSFAPRIFVTAGGLIGINCGGTVVVAPIERWHQEMNKPFVKHLVIPEGIQRGPIRHIPSGTLRVGPPDKPFIEIGPGKLRGAFGPIAPEDRAAFESPSPDAVGDCINRVESVQAKG